MCYQHPKTAQPKNADNDDELKRQRTRNTKCQGKIV